MFGVVTTLIALLILFLVLPNWRSSAFLAPGPLSQVHAQLLHTAHEHSDAAILENARCASCHPIALTAEETELLVLSHARDGEPAAVGLQSLLCLNCHHESMPNAREGAAHDLIGADLQNLFDSAGDSKPTKLASQTTECSQCHREHRADGRSLDHITSQKCQACHRNQFDSFADGHPEFENYPIPEPRRIAFDHAAHRDLHFSKKNKEFDCRVCHTDESSSGQIPNVFRSVSFEKACASCHVEPLLHHATDGVVVLQLPSLDRARLKRVGVDIGPWPESASQIMEGELSSLWRELILAEDGGESVLADLPASGRLSDIDWEDPVQVANIRQLTEAMRNAFNKIAREGQPRVSSVMAQAVSNRGIEVYPNPKPTEYDSKTSHAWIAMFA